MSNWTTNKPTEPEHYWMRSGPGHIAKVVQVVRMGDETYYWLLVLEPGISSGPPLTDLDPEFEWQRVEGPKP